MMVDVPPADSDTLLPAVAEPTVATTRVMVIGILAGLVLLAALGLSVVILGGATASPPVVDAVQAPQVVQTSPVHVPSTVRDTAVRVDPAWAARMGAQVGIPAQAMVAYGDAQFAMAKRDPGCHLSWNTLAGIGWIESQHGTLGGRTVLADGYSSTTIVGPALDGTTYAAIHSTPESQAWHGDPVWEHAVGPMQFIASTWDRWGTDGDGDGKADPRDIADAALTAGRYLCADGHDLATPQGWQAAIHSFNHDQAYVTNVLAAANTYAERSAARG
ncbi:MAG: Membrane-bound lytic murein transglycosylase B-like protein [Marmoricola sp.]|nr:Membrane-bound lytic murein transglycosylase B-like protein [Marmoricola sp.]